TSRPSPPRATTRSDPAGTISRRADTAHRLKPFVWQGFKTVGGARPTRTFGNGSGADPRRLDPPASGTGGKAAVPHRRTAVGPPPQNEPPGCRVRKDTNSRPGAGHPVT